jgi:hypothetical protein
VVMEVRRGPEVRLLRLQSREKVGNR